MSIIIREFQPGDEPAFFTLNEEWISRYFVLETKDLETIQDPHGSILDRGGKIFFAVDGGKPVGCCALLKMGGGEFEIAKMAVTESARGAGIGRNLLAAVIEAAKKMGAGRLFLETNRKLAPAIHLYEAAGFRHLPPERFISSPYARSNVQMEMLLVSGLSPHQS